MLAKPSKSQVKAILRIRPFLPTENSEEPCINIVDHTSANIINCRNTNESFVYNFDACLDSSATQTEVFENVKPTIEQLFNGRNATVFAYGITGAGKTFTMDGTIDNPGVIPRAAEYLFSKISRLNKLAKAEAVARETMETVEYFITLSHLEIYNEKVYDLSDNKRQELDIRQDACGNIVVANLNDALLNDIKHFEKHYDMTKNNRSTASTLLNACSSRSHSVLRLSVIIVQLHQRNHHVVVEDSWKDLAGSEDNRKTGNNKERMKESGNINKSLFMLNQVVNALNEGATCIPYRNSKLTRLLQDSLGGKADALMITNVAPSFLFYSDTMNTLNLARRTRRIVHNPVVVAQTQLDHLPSIKRKLEESESTKPTKKLHSTKFKTAFVEKDEKYSLKQLIEHATPRTKQGIIRAMERTEPAKIETANKRLGDLLKDYPLRPNESKEEKENHPEAAPLPPESEAKKKRTSKSKQDLHVPLVDPEIYSKYEAEGEKELVKLLNCKSVKLLTTLKGIGVNRAQQIVDHETVFTGLDDLKQVGLGNKIVDKMKVEFINKWIFDNKISV